MAKKVPHHIAADLLLKQLEHAKTQEKTQDKQIEILSTTPWAHWTHNSLGITKGCRISQTLAKSVCTMLFPIINAYPMKRQKDGLVIGLRSAIPALEDTYPIEFDALPNVYVGFRRHTDHWETMFMSKKDYQDLDHEIL